MKILKLKRAKLHITFNTEYNDLKQILTATPNLKDLELVGIIPSFVYNNNRIFRELFSKELHQVKLDLQVKNFLYVNYLTQHLPFDIDTYWHNVKWTKTQINFHQIILQLTALGYVDQQ